MSDTASAQGIYYIPFMQYVRPNGKRIAQVYATSNMMLAYMASDIIGCGMRFECEVLTTGRVSVTVFDIMEEADIAIEVCKNDGIELRPAIDRLIRTAHAILLTSGKLKPAKSH